MKTKLFIIVIFLVNMLLSVNAQNYQVVHKENQYVYQATDNISINFIKYVCGGGHHYLRTCKIDSSRFYNDTLELFPYREIYDTLIISDENKISWNSWIGKKILFLTSGENDLIFENADTIKIKSNGLIGDSWTMFNYRDGDSLIASVEGISSYEVFGLVDTIITIQFFLSSSPATVITRIKIGKNTGFIEVCDFRELIFFKSVQANFKLISKNYKDLQYYGDWSFNVGDELHYSYIYTHNGTSDYYEYAIKKYISKTTISDSVKYEIARTVWGSFPNYGPPPRLEHFYKVDTLYESVKLNNSGYFDTIHVPFEAIISNDSLDLTTFLEYKDPSFYNNRTVVHDLGTSYYKNFPGDSIYHSTFDSYEAYCNFDIQGIGTITQYSAQDAGQFTDRTTNLVYYKINSEEWGTPLVPVGFKKLEQELVQFSTYPNPTHGEFKINTTSLVKSVMIVDMLGRNTKLYSIDNTFDISNFPNGIYILNLMGFNKKIKIVKY